MYRMILWNAPHSILPVGTGTALGFYKLNTDATWKRGQAAGGAVVQGDEGSWVSGFSIKFKAISPEEAELVAIKHGLRFVEELQIEVEFDAKQIYNLLIEKAKSILNIII
ncbi:hypothetical protein RDABS01_039990 [Bienertia sinuspersici]